MCDYFGALSMKVLKCRVFFKVVTNINTEETRLWTGKKEKRNYEIWNICSNEKSLTSFESI